MTDHFSISDHVDRSVVRITFIGELDLAAVPALCDHIATWLEEHDVMWIIVDLAETRFVDSLGLGALIRAQRQSTEFGKIFGVVGAKGDVAQVLELTGLAEVLSLPEDTPTSPKAVRTGIAEVSGNAHIAHQA
jgi:anti-sigma B factor antagonist